MTVYYLFQQIQLLKQDNTKEVTDLFEKYLQEIKLENQQLHEEVSTTTSEPKQKNAHEPIMPRKIKSETKETIIENDESALQTDKIDDKFETSLEAQILQLYHQGIEVEEIAKKLNCGTTEAALIINLYEKRSHKA